MIQVIDGPDYCQDDNPELHSYLLDLLERLAAVPDGATGVRLALHQVKDRRCSPRGKIFYIRITYNTNGSQT